MSTDSKIEVMDYDPNLVLCGRMPKQAVKLVFGRWKYRAEMTVMVGGNCTGLTVIRGALSIAYDSLEFKTYGNDDIARIVLKDAAGNELLDEDEDMQGEDWLEKMLISAEIVSIQPDEE